MGFWNKQKHRKMNARHTTSRKHNGNNKMMAHIKHIREKKQQRWKPTHPGRLTWNLHITHLERNMIFQTSMNIFFEVSPFSLAEWFFWVNFQGSKVSESSWWSTPPKSCLTHPQLAATFHYILSGLQGSWDPDWLKSLYWLMKQSLLQSYNISP